MRKRHYYCLVAGLPDLIPDDKKQHFSSIDLRDYLQRELHKADFELVKLFYMPYDHENLINIFYEKNEEWDDRGNYTRSMLELAADKKQLEELDFSVYPSYISKFIKDFHLLEEDIPKAQAIHDFSAGWYELLESSGNDFVKSIAGYKNNMGNILLAMNGRKYNLPYEELLIGENELTHNLKKSRARDFGITDENIAIENIIQMFETDNILEREMRFDNNFWKFLDDNTFFNYFTIEKVLAFVLKLMITERWFVLDKEKGQQIFNKFLEELKSNFEFPEEFAITYGKRK